MRWLIVVILVANLRGAVLDRMAIVIGQTVITETQIDEELRLTAFLNHEEVPRTTEARRAAAGRLVEQQIVKREILLTRYPPPSAEATERSYAATEKLYGGASGMNNSMKRYGLSDSVVRTHLKWQLTLLKFVDERFRPDVEVSDQDIQTYYKQQVETWKKTHRETPPSLETSRASIEKTLSDQRSEYALSAWIDETRRDVQIEYLDKDLERQ